MNHTKEKTDINVNLIHSVSQKLGSLQKNVHDFLIWEGVCYSLISASTIILGVLALDWYIRFNLTSRIFILSFSLAILGIIIHRFIRWPLLHRTSYRDLALKVENHYPVLGDRLISVIEISELHNWMRFPHQIVQKVLIETKEIAERLDFNSVVNWRRLKFIRLCIFLCLGLWIGLFIAIPGYIWRIGADRLILLGKTPWPQRTEIWFQGWNPENEETRYFVQGQNLALVVFANPEKSIPQEVILYYRFFSKQWESVKLVSGRSNRFSTTLKGLNREILFYAQAGDAQTPLYRALAMIPPQIKTMSLKIEPPLYSKRETQNLDYYMSSMDISVLCDSVLHVKGVATKTLKGGTCIPPQGIPVPLRLENETSFGFSMPFPKGFVSGQVSISLTDKEGLTNPKAGIFTIKVTIDTPPAVQLSYLGISSMVTSKATLPLNFVIEDDMGIGDARVVYQIAKQNQKPDDRKSFPISSLGYKNPINIENAIKIGPVTCLWEIAQLGLFPGHRLLFLIEAQDSRNGKSPDGRPLSPNIGRSCEITLNIVTPQELLSDILLKQQALRRRFEMLVEKERQIKWKILELKERFDKEADKNQESRPIYMELANSQRYISHNLNEIVSEMKAIVNEMKNNLIGEKALFQSIEERIIQPIQVLANGPLLLTANQLDTIGSGISHEKGKELLNEIYHAVLDIIIKMEAILSGMSNTEAFGDIVNRLKEILKLENELLKETEKAQVRKIRQLLEEEK